MEGNSEGNVWRGEQADGTKKVSQKSVRKRSKEDEEEEHGEVRLADWEEEDDRFN